MPRSGFDVLFMDFYGTVTSGDFQAVERASQQVIDDHSLEVAASDFSMDWGRRFFMPNSLWG